jgi:hypothetical protein
MPPREIFETMFRVTPGCWIWLRNFSPKGYGQICGRGRTVMAHRLSYETYVGPIPAGLFLLHSCDNRKCVNPDHLRPGTHRENMRDMSDRKRSSSGPGEMAPNAKLKATQAMSIYHDKRRQKIVAAEYAISVHTIKAIKSKAIWSSIHAQPVPTLV